MTTVLLVGGVDPTGRAGLAADLDAAHTLGARAAVVVSALTVQGQGRFQVKGVGPALLRAELAAALSVKPRAVKVGMVPDRAHLAVLVRGLRGFAGPVVIDPVVLTSRGERLSRLEASDYLALGRALRRPILTPNDQELVWLGGEAAVLAAGFEAVLCKGGERASDLLLHRGRRSHFRGRPLHRSRLHHRGTGCRLATGLAVGLGASFPLDGAVRQARRLVRRFLSRPILPQDVIPAAGRSTL